MFDLRYVLKLHMSMSFRATALKRRFGTVLILGLICATAHAQQPPPPPRPVIFVNHDAIVTTLVKAPTYGGTGDYVPPDDFKWLKVEFHYSVVAPPGAASPVGDYLDEAEFKLWIEARDLLDPAAKPGGEGIAIAFTGSVTYVNIPKGRDLYGVVYVHPNSLTRYTNRRGVNEFLSTYDVHIEADVAGVPVDGADKKREQDPNWYKQLRALPGLVYRQDQCPFIVTDPDRYPAIRPVER